VRRTQLDGNEKAVRWDLPDLSKFMMATGIRIGEALGVFWEDIDFGTGTVDIAHTVVRVKGPGLYRKLQPKSSAGERVLPLASWVLELRRAEVLGDGRDSSSPVFASGSSGRRAVGKSSCGSRRTRSGRPRRRRWTMPTSRLG
jgi:integrase